MHSSDWRTNSFLFRTKTERPIEKNLFILGYSANVKEGWPKAEELVRFVATLLNVECCRSNLGRPVLTVDPHRVPPAKYKSVIPIVTFCLIPAHRHAGLHFAVFCAPLRRSNPTMVQNHWFRQKNVVGTDHFVTLGLVRDFRILSGARKAKSMLF